MTNKTFLNLEHKYSNLENSKIVIQPIPFELTTSYQKGTKNGPKAIIEASKYLELFDIETKSCIYKKGIYTTPPSYFSTSQEMIKNLSDKTYNFLENKKFIVTVGGEHSISFPCIQAHAKYYNKISILQLDAHADLHPALDNNPYSHGSVIARIKEIKEVDKVVAVGIRSMSEIENYNLSDQTTIYAKQVHESLSWIDEVIKSLNNLVYITFDLDVFDPSVILSTGTPEPGGLFWDQIFMLLKKVTETKKVIGFDVVELMPIKGIVSPDFTAAKAIYKLLSLIFKDQK
jgi:N1-aminopropylagmatine ureohydrolase